MTENWIQVVNIKTAKYKLVFIRNPVVVALDWCIYWHFGCTLSLESANASRCVTEKRRMWMSQRVSETLSTDLSLANGNVSVSVPRQMHANLRSQSTPFFDEFESLRLKDTLKSVTSLMTRSIF